MKQLTLNWLSFSLFFFLIFSCKKKEDFLPLKTGKYRVDYKVVHPNGTIDTYQFTAYGPRTTGYYYKFSIKVTDTTNFKRATLSTTERRIKGLAWLNYNETYGESVKITEYECSEDNLTMYFTSYQPTDSISGTIIFNSIE
ncbi:hypothetical protein [Fluviicola taffensis]|uniref:Lipoprotein n=1 Tax=Fluviicola taffensis (strain DSM 16823 / NCIMB 13979 / RW262) TaxID=755732 RepID=F2IIY0_FLUTR|nr:hypothetical protein [Fluviicola taffensis]AEA43838.1 hypothetical protein Fluta_1851 [Fluviicola taffensis DSM 16823]